MGDRASRWGLTPLTLSPHSEATTLVVCPLSPPPLGRPLPSVPGAVTLAGCPAGRRRQLQVLVPSTCVSVNASGLGWGSGGAGIIRRSELGSREFLAGGAALHAGARGPAPGTTTSLNTPGGQSTSDRH